MLIAEDQEMNAEVLTNLLKMEEMSSEWARNGQLAVEMFSQCEENHFDAILMEHLQKELDDMHPENVSEAWLIDPAVSVGHFEAELAMTELFGGFPQRFYGAYHEVNPIDGGYRERRDL